MSKPYCRVAALSLALVALPAVAEAGDCPELDRAGRAVADGTHRVVHGVVRVGEHVVRAGDRVLGLIFCDHLRR